ncbi:MAG: alpha/beta fold hydrolase, partial [Lachnospiraceae bacterium]|nr:alpha/beta fold hydrolase [Lachnospiraceae bacterium]
ACLKNAFCQMCVTVCGRFVPNEGGIGVKGIKGNMFPKNPDHIQENTELFDFELAEDGYCSHLRQSSRNHAPKSVIIHTSITYKLMKTGVGVNCNPEDEMELRKSRKSFLYLEYYGTIILAINVLKKEKTKDVKGECKMASEKILPYERIGDSASSTTLVFLHGSTMSMGGMHPFASAFNEYNCIVFDLTGHGKSDEKEPDKISVFAEDVEYSLNRLKEQNIATEQVILLGYSMGGAITCEIAARGKLELGGIVLLSSGADLKNYTPLVDNLKTVPMEKFQAEDILDALFGPDTTDEDKKRIKELFISTKSADATGYMDLMVSNAYNNLEACREIKIPALMVHGSSDIIVEPMAAVETWRAIEGSQLLMVPYKGHSAIFEDTEMIKDKIVSFIKMCS